MKYSTVNLDVTGCFGAVVMILLLLLLSISLSLDYIKNIAKSNKLINSNVKNTKYKYYIRKIVDKIFTSHQNLYSIKSMSKNMYYKKPKFGIKTRHDLHGQFSPFHLFIFVLNWQRDCEFRIVGGNICHSCGPLNRTLSVPLLTDRTLG